MESINNGSWVSARSRRFSWHCDRLANPSLERKSTRTRVWRPGHLRRWGSHIPSLTLKVCFPMQRLRIGTRTVSHKPDSLDTPSDLLACRDAKTSLASRSWTSKELSHQNLDSVPNALVKCHSKRAILRSPATNSLFDGAAQYTNNPDTKMVGI